MNNENDLHTLSIRDFMLSIRFLHNYRQNIPMKDIESASVDTIITKLNTILTDYKDLHQQRKLKNNNLKSNT